MESLILIKQLLMEIGWNDIFSYTIIKTFNCIKRILLTGKKRMKEKTKGK